MENGEDEEETRAAKLGGWDARLESQINLSFFSSLSFVKDPGLRTDVLRTEGPGPLLARSLFP
jgi:hypothetical protein